MYLDAGRIDHRDVLVSAPGKREVDHVLGRLAERGQAEQGATVVGGPFEAGIDRRRRFGFQAGIRFGGATAKESRLEQRRRLEAIAPACPQDEIRIQVDGRAEAGGQLRTEPLMPVGTYSAGQGDVGGGFEFMHREQAVNGKILVGRFELLARGAERQRIAFVNGPGALIAKDRAPAFGAERARSGAEILPVDGGIACQEQVF